MRGSASPAQRVILRRGKRDSIAGGGGAERDTRSGDSAGGRAALASLGSRLGEGNPPNPRKGFSPRGALPDAAEGGWRQPHHHPHHHPPPSPAALRRVRGREWGSPGRRELPSSRNAGHAAGSLLKATQLRIF